MLTIVRAPVVIVLLAVGVLWPAIWSGKPAQRKATPGGLRHSPRSQHSHGNRGYNGRRLCGNKTTPSRSTAPASARQQPSPTASSTPAAPQPAAPFPWSNLITAVSTVTAGLGGIFLKDRLDIKRDRGQRRRDAYAGLMLSLDELTRVIGAPLTVGSDLFPGSLGHAIAQAVGTVQRAYFAVYLAGSSRVQPVAGKAWQAAWDIHDWGGVGVGPGLQQRTAIDELEDLRAKLREAAAAFADAARSEIAN